MTRPVRPASPLAEIRGTRKAVESLAKRPAPIAEGGGDLPWARAQRHTTNQSIPHNSVTDVTWTEYVNLGAGESGEGVFAADSLTPQQDLLPLVEGVYLVKIGLAWDGINVGKFAFGISHNSGSVASIEWFYGDTNHNSAGWLHFFATSLQHGVDPGPSIRWSLSLHHAAGAARDLDYAFLHAVRLGDYTGAAWDSGDLIPMQP